MNKKLSNSLYASRTSEMPFIGHPDKVADQISDAILDRILTQDKIARVACNTFISQGIIVVGGEITTTADFDVEKIAKELIKTVGYSNSKLDFDCEKSSIINVIGKQSPDISKGVDISGCGDSGIMFGYATDETPSFMPLAYELARKLAMEQKYVREHNILDFLGPDGKAQVTIEYDSLGHANHIKSVVFSTQHKVSILDKKDPTKISEEANRKILETIIIPSLPLDLLDSKTEILVNPNGSFVIAGPTADSGITGKKCVSDQYGPEIQIGGGAFSGKDPTKVDRSGAYMMRYIAKNIVAAGIAQKCLAQVSYAIGQPYPVSFELDFKGTSGFLEREVKKYILSLFNLSPREIIKHLDLRNPIYSKTAEFGHFGFPEFNWEKLDLVDSLRTKFIK